jgi:guanylate kinase
MAPIARKNLPADKTPRSQLGYLVVISAPSGGGKTSIIRGILDAKDSDYSYSISMTTRPPRPGERHGHDYYFISPAEFEQKIRDNGFVEWAEVHNYLYGTPRAALDGLLAAGKLVLMDLDVQGGLNVKQKYGDHAILIFIKPPSLESLKARLHRRNTDSLEDIDVRLQAAARELAMAEQYDHIIINNDLQETVKQVAAIVNSRRAPSNP